MRYAICSFIVILGFCAGYFAGQAENKESAAGDKVKQEEKAAPAPADVKNEESKKPGKPVVPEGWRLDPPDFNFGKVREGVEVSTSIEIFRPENQKLHIGRLYSSCPCVSLKAPNRIVEKGKKATIEISIHSLTINGKKKYPVYVEILEPQKIILEATIEIEAERVPAKIMLSPDTFQLGSVNGVKYSAIKLYNLTKRPIKITEVKCNIEGASVTPSQKKIVPAGQDIEIKLELDGAKLSKGPIQGSVTVSTDLPEHAGITIPVQGTALGKK